MAERKEARVRARQIKRTAVVSVVRGRLGALGILALLTLALSAPAAMAAPPPFFASFPEGGSGSGGNQLLLPAAIAADPETGHLFVGERKNNRISEFTAWGEFVKTWGWGVVASGPGNDPHNDTQTVSLDPGVTGGTLKLAYVDVTASVQGKTTAIQHNASAADVRLSIESLPFFAPGDLSVTGPAGGPWVVEFVGAFADTDTAQLEPTDITLVGGSASTHTNQHGGSFEICRPAVGDVCRAGQSASELPGQIFLPRGLVVDPALDSVYVYEGEHQFMKNLRVQRFATDTAAFELMIGGEVNRSKETNVCTSGDLEAGDVCRGGKLGTAPSYFSNILGFGNIGTGGNVTLDASGTLYVGDKNRVQKFAPDGSYLGQIPLPEEGEVKSLAYDTATTSLIMSFAQLTGSPEPINPNIYKLNPSTGSVLAVIDLDFPFSIAPNPLGNIFVIAHRYPVSGLSTLEVIEFDSAGNPIIPLTQGFDSITPGSNSGVTRPGLVVNDACYPPGSDLYALYVVDGADSEVDAFGPTPDPEICPPPKVPPTIADQFAVEVGSDRAVVRGRINPRFWADTRFYVEYGTSDCELGGCTATQPLPPGALLPGAGVNQFLTTPKVTISGLQPGTKYHFRIVAESEGGGPVYGVGEAEADATFTTRSQTAASNTACPNQRFRTGAAAALPDCRAYEMVSPVDKGEGNAIARLGGVKGASASLNQSAGDGGRFTFSSYRSFGDAEASTYSTQYLATRAAAGWTSTGISPAGGPSLVTNLTKTLINEYLHFDSDLCSAWFRRISDPPLTETAPGGYANLYRRQNCSGPPSFSAMINGPVEAAEAKQFFPQLQGVSEDGNVAVFRAEGKLTANAAATALLPQVYADVDGALELVSVLPNGQANAVASTVGTRFHLGFNRTDAVSRAVSTDGKRIYWTSQFGADGTEGQIYLRLLDSEQTKPVSGLVSSAGAIFQTAAENGSVAYFLHGADLYRYSLASESVQLVAGQVAGTLGASADGSRLYLVSKEALAGGATAGEGNLYLWEDGAFTFVAGLAARDLNKALSSPINPMPVYHLARVTEDGGHLAFMSSSKALSEATAGFDNTDAVSGEPNAQVYVYDLGSGQLNCVSCDPTETRPTGRLIDKFGQVEPEIWASAEIPGWTTQAYPSRVLREDGNRLFFNSYIPLTGADTNDAADVYQWEAPGTGDCSTEAAAYVPTTNGCVALISTGSSSEDSEFVDASASGSDVFFLTESSLVAKDPEAIDVYDARVGGGFAEPEPPAACVGDGCQPTAPPPARSVPVTPIPQAQGNVMPKKGRKCAKGKHRVKRKGKVRCVRKGKSKKRRAVRKVNRGHHRRGTK